MIGKIYSKEEKKSILDEFRKSGMSRCAFAVAKGIPKTTFSGWVKSDRINTFGEIDLNSSSFKTDNVDINKNSIVFTKEDMRIELKEGFDKEFLRKIVEVLTNVN